MRWATPALTTLTGVSTTHASTTRVFIVREAFAEDDAERAREAKEREEKNKPVASNITRLPRGAYAPFDTEAT